MHLRCKPLPSNGSTFVHFRWNSFFWLCVIIRLGCIFRCNAFRLRIFDVHCRLTAGASNRFAVQQSWFESSMCTYVQATARKAVQPLHLWCTSLTSKRHSQLRRSSPLLAFSSKRQEGAQLVLPCRLTASAFLLACTS